MSYAVRTLGTTAMFAPQIKRAIGRLSTGRTVVFVPDTNRSDSNGADVTGVAKFHLYVSDDEDRDSFTLSISTTPTQAGMSSTKRFIGSFAVGQDGDAHLAYQGTDNSLRHLSWNWNGTGYDAAVSQTVVAANAVTDRYRAIDLDVTGSPNITPCIIVYEAGASTGQGATMKVYIRLNDATTWRKAYEQTIHSSAFIKAGGEDVSISVGADGPLINIIRIALYWTGSSTTGDNGDVLREISFNTSTGTDNSATVIGSWSTNLNQSLVSGSRKGWLFKNKTISGDACWVFAGMVGYSTPFYVGIKLHHNSFTYTLNRTTGNPSAIMTSKMQALTFSDRQIYCAVTANYHDESLQFLFLGQGVSSYNSTMRSVVFVWSDDEESDLVSVKDAVSRVADNNYSAGDGMLAIYGGANYVSAGAGEFSSLAIYGAGGNTVSASASVLERNARLVVDEVFPAPTISQPNLHTVSKNRVDFQLFSTAGVPFKANKGKLELEISSDPTYTDDLRQIEEDDTLYRAYTSPNGTFEPIHHILYTLTLAEQLFTGDWYYRARIKDDLVGYSDWVESTFSVSHPPSALTVAPAGTTTIKYDSGDIRFAWQFSDTEPTDSQTAYQIVLTRLDTLATVTDTGKVSSVNNFGIITITTALKDIPLSWTVRLWDGDDNPGDYSNPVQFTVAEKPQVVILTPVDNSTVTTALPTVTWSFNAPLRTQTHYRVVVINLDTSPNETVGDTGWLTGSETTYTFAAQILENTTDYKVKVYVRDSAGMQAEDETNYLGNPAFEGQTTSGWTDFASSIAISSTFAHDSSYSLRLTPDGGAPAYVESITFDALEDNFYVGKVWVYTPGGYSDVFVELSYRDGADAEISTETTTSAVAVGQWTQLTVTGTAAPALTEGIRLRIGLDVTPAAGDITYFDDAELMHAQTDFDTAWTPPDSADDVVVTADAFKVTVAWSDDNQDVDFVSWRVYRKYNKVSNTDLDVDDTANTWVLIYETTDIETTYEYRDYFYPLNKDVEYIVVQLVDRFGSLMESNLPAGSLINYAGDRYYFVPAVPIGSIASFEASYVTVDNFRAEVEQATLHVIGRGRQVQLGDDLGKSGELQLKLRNPDTARSDREFIELLVATANGAVYIRSPFGDVLYVNFGSPSFSRMAGVGTSDLGDLSVPYTEVFEEAPVTRLV